MAKRIVVGRKLLVASLGVAAISYVACTTSQPSLDGGSGADAAADAKADGPVTSGNLMPPPPVDAAADAPVTSGNLMPPPPVDGGDDGSTDGGAD
jgi:hypothetical protein